MRVKRCVAFEPNDGGNNCTEHDQKPPQLRGLRRLLPLAEGHFEVFVQPVAADLQARSKRPAERT